MNHHRRRSRSWVAVFVACTAAAAAALMVVSRSPANGDTRGSNTHRLAGAIASSSRASPTATAAFAPLRLLTASPPDGATSVPGTQPVSLTTTSPTDLAYAHPTITPALPGTWTADRNTITFRPDGAFPPDTTVTVEVPSGLRTKAGAHLADPQTVSFRTATGSVLRLQQVLAGLAYLPLHWTGPTIPRSLADQQQAVFAPPPGTFTWAWPNVPPTLAAAWTPGADTVMTRGAVMAFEADHNLTVDGVAGTNVWAALLAASTATSPAVNSHGYTYALASKASPETLTVWHDGTVTAQSAANTGIAQAPTVDGTFPVYERLATQTMRGTNPDGSRYADPVAWVAYFNGGDAIHYIPRSSYGSPQSLGCVEIPYQTGHTIWPQLTLGTLVTVAG